MGVPGYHKGYFATDVIGQCTHNVGVQYYLLYKMCRTRYEEVDTVLEVVVEICNSIS